MEAVLPDDMTQYLNPEVSSPINSAVNESSKNGYRFGKGRQRS